MKQTTIEQVMENLMKIENEKESDIHNSIICAFSDYTFKGKSEVLVTSPSSLNSFEISEGEHYTYINHIEAPIINFELEKVDDDNWTIVRAW